MCYDKGQYVVFFDDIDRAFFVPENQVVRTPKEAVFGVPSIQKLLAKGNSLDSKSESSMSILKQDSENQSSDTKSEMIPNSRVTLPVNENISISKPPGRRQTIIHLNLSGSPVIEKAPSSFEPHPQEEKAHECQTEIANRQSEVVKKMDNKGKASPRTPRRNSMTMALNGLKSAVKLQRSPHSAKSTKHAHFEDDDNSNITSEDRQQEVYPDDDIILPKPSTISFLIKKFFNLLKYFV